VEVLGARRGSGAGAGVSSLSPSAPTAVAHAALSEPVVSMECAATEDRVLNLFLTDGKHLTERKVPGIVSAPCGALEFGVVQAKLQATEFVGFRPLKRGEDIPSSTGETSAKGSKGKRSVSSSVKAALLGGQTHFFEMLNKSTLVGGTNVECTAAPAAAAAAAAANDGAAGSGMSRASTASAVECGGSGGPGAGSDSNGGEGGCGAGRSAIAAATAAGSRSTSASWGGEFSDFVTGDDGMGVFEIMWKDGGGTGPLRRLAFEANKSAFAYIREQVCAWSAAAAAAGDGAASASHRRRVSAGDAVPPLQKSLDFVGRGGSKGESEGERGGSDAINASGGGLKGGAGAGAGRRSGQSSMRRTQSDVNPPVASDERTGVDGGNGAEAGDEGRLRETWETSTSVVLTPGVYDPTLSEESAILSAEQVRSVAAALPARCRLCNWRLAYSSRRDGISLRSLYRSAAGREVTLNPKS